MKKVRLAGIAEELKEFREARTLTQDDLARMLGVAQSTIRNWENSRTSPRPKMALRIRALAGGSAPPATAPLARQPVGGKADPLTQAAAHEYVDDVFRFGGSGQIQHMVEELGRWADAAQQIGETRPPRKNKRGT